MNLTQRQVDAFWAKVQITETCWLWIASVGWNGYGMFGRPTKRAHRVSLHLAEIELKEGEYGLHKCGNKRCVRVHPEHVYVGTSKQNALDRSESGFKPTVSHVPGSLNGEAKLTEEQVLEIRRLYLYGDAGPDRRSLTSCAALAERFGVGSSAIKRIVNRQTWRHI